MIVDVIFGIAWLAPSPNAVRAAVTCAQCKCDRDLRRMAQWESRGLRHGHASERSDRAKSRGCSWHWQPSGAPCRHMLSRSTRRLVAPLGAGVTFAMLVHPSLPWLTTLLRVSNVVSKCFDYVSGID